MLRTEERELGRGFKWRGAFRRMQEQLLALEAHSQALELVYPQVRALKMSCVISGTLRENSCSGFESVGQPPVLLETLYRHAMGELCWSFVNSSR